MKKRKRTATAPDLPTESRAAEMVTVSWMLSTVVALACELGWVVARWWLVWDNARGPVQALVGLLFFSSLVIGAISLLLVPVVLKSRRVAPPTGVTVFAAVVGIAPWLVAAWRAIAD